MSTAWAKIAGENQVFQKAGSQRKPRSQPVREKQRPKRRARSLFEIEAELRVHEDAMLETHQCDYGCDNGENCPVNGIIDRRNLLAASNPELAARFNRK